MAPPLSQIITILFSFAVYGSAQETRASFCAALKATPHLRSTTIISAHHIAAPANISTPGLCQSQAPVSTSICRVQFIVNTTLTSAVRAEVWLPEKWSGRFLGLGNGGLGGCIDYLNLEYNTSLHFTTVASDSGHDGNGLNGTSFLNHPEVINDLSFRSVHVEAVISKQIVQAYYQRPHHRSYYLGCSNGGRQGTQATLKYPEDFDGIVAGAPATDYNVALGWAAMMGRYVGAPHPNDSMNFIPPAL